MKQPYSTQKILHHPDVLDALRAREPAPLVQIHFMPQLACNHGCSFCLLAGTQVSTVRGPVAIEDIEAGNYVVTGHRVAEVIEVGDRWAEDLTEIHVHGISAPLRLTADHPVFTERGFVSAGQVKLGDQVAVSGAPKWGRRWEAHRVVTFKGEVMQNVGFSSVVAVGEYSGRHKVHNLECTAEAYLAGEVLVHNCAYGHRVDGDGAEQFGWKNMQMMSDAHLPATKMRELVEDWADMHVRAVELTGGGEPLLWPHVDEFFRLMADHPSIELALVTNGTALTEERAKLFDRCNWKWARVSIDAGAPEQYSRTHRVSRTHWDKAWDAVCRLAARKYSDPERRVGVGYTVDRHNMTGILGFVVRAKQLGADNVRISAAFTPQHLARFDAEGLREARRQAAQAKAQLESAEFQVNNLLDERLDNLAQPYQDYDFCATKEALCVVGGDQKVYHCCSLAFNEAGLVGSIENQRFRSLWDSDYKRRAFQCHNPRKQCAVECLYAKRNLQTLEILAKSDDEIADLAARDDSMHRNFL